MVLELERDHDDWEEMAFLLQVGSANFPTGGFNHSYGLETLLAWEYVEDAATLECFVSDWVRYSVAPLDGTAVALAYHLFLEGDWEGLEALDAYVSAAKVPREAFLASEKVGTATLRGLRHVFGGDGLRDLDIGVRDGRLKGNQALILGAACAERGIGLDRVIDASLQGAVNNLVSVAARLVPLGQLDAQRVLHECWPAIRYGRDIAKEGNMETLGSMAPIWDIAAMEHESLDVRLCIS